MFDYLLPFCFFALFFFFAQEKRDKYFKITQAHKGAAMRQFLAFKTDSTNPSFVFHGEKATIIKTSEDQQQIDNNNWDYFLTIYAMNPHGEYFLFISNQNAAPFFKHITHTNAKIALGVDYVEPQVK